MIFNGLATWGFALKENEGAGGLVCFGGAAASSPRGDLLKVLVGVVLKESVGFWKLRFGSAPG